MKDRNIPNEEPFLNFNSPHEEEHVPNLKDLSGNFGNSDGLENFETQRIQEELLLNVSNMAQASVIDQSYSKKRDMPLSRHYPLEVLHSSSSCASKNLLILSRG